MRVRKEAAVWPAMAAGILAMVAGMASISPALAETVTKLPFCAGAKGALAKDAALRDAVVVALARTFATPPLPPRTAPMIRRTATCRPRCCTTKRRRPDHGPRGRPIEHTTIAKLSAYVLRATGSAFRLVTVKRDFGEGQDGWGNPGDITEAHFGDDDGMMISGGYMEQGETNSSAAFYVFRHGGLASLGAIPTGYTNGGAVGDDSKAVYVKGAIAAGEPQPDRVRVTYTIRAGAKTRTQETVWRSDNGKFVLESGTLPQEIAAHADVSPSSSAVGNGTDSASAANDDRTKAGPRLTIEDRDLAPVPSRLRRP